MLQKLFSQARNYRGMEFLVTLRCDVVMGIAVCSLETFRGSVSDMMKIYS